MKSEKLNELNKAIEAFLKNHVACKSQLHSMALQVGEDGELLDQIEINTWRNGGNIFEAVEIAEAVLAGMGVKLVDDRGDVDGGDYIGNIYSIAEIGKGGE